MRIVPVDLGAVREALRLPGALTVVSHHHGADGVWRVRCAGRDLALKVRPLDDWTRAQPWGEAAHERFEVVPRATELSGALGSSLNWTAFSMWLSLGHRDVDDAVRRAATERVTRLCREVVARATDPEPERGGLRRSRVPVIAVER